MTSRKAGFTGMFSRTNAVLSERLQGTTGLLTLAGAVFLLVAGIGAATSYLRAAPEAATTGGAVARSASDTQANGDTVARLKDYTRSIGAGDAPQPGSPQAANKLLPDVNTMIERLAARLEAAPQDVKGWRMLGWSYFHTARYEQAAGAYGKAMELEPGSAEIKTLYEEAKAKAAGGEKPATASLPQSEAGEKVGDGQRVDRVAKSAATPAHEPGAEIRAMVDGLASRLESSPRDVEGWTRLLRSRVVLGERDVAATALRKALEVFRDDSAASERITAAATELGLKAE